MNTKLLIVDDEATMRRLYSHIFHGTGYGFDLAASLGEARALIRLRPYALIITDFNLGDGFGTELFEVAQGSGGCGVILVSGSLEETEEKALYLRYPIAAFFSKPFKSEELLCAVRGLLSLKLNK